MVELPAPGATTRCGDLALAFGDHRPTRSRGDAPWSVVLDGEGWRLWATDPGPGWRGYDLHRTPDPSDLLLTLGRRPEHWLSLHRDPDEGRWAVRTDRFATLHAYAGAGIVATFSPATWGDDPPLDWGAVAGFVRLGWYPADRLPAAGTRLLRPATEERWADDGTSLGARSWRGWDHQGVTDRSLDQSVDAFASVLDEVLDQEADGVRLGVPISGGLDSRVTVASLSRPGAHHRLWPYSYGYDADSVELRIAGEVAAARGLGLQRTVIGPYLWDDLDPVLDATEGLVDVTLCRQACMAGRLRTDTDAVVAAHWGDVWFGAPEAPTGQSGAEALLAASTKRGHEWLTDHLVRPHLGADPDEELRDVLAAEAGRITAPADPAVAQLALKTEQWSWRWTQASLRAFRIATEPRLPFYDPRMADFALSLPAEQRRGRVLQVEYLRRRAPDLAAVEWQAVETDLFRLGHERTWRLPRRALRRLARTLRPPTARLRNWEVQLLDPAARPAVDRWLLEPGAAVHDLVDRAEVADLVQRHRERPTDPGLGYAVAQLLTLATWKARFT